MEEALAERARRIEETLAARGIAARVTGGAVTPRWVRFDLFPLLEAGYIQIGEMGEPLAAALEAQACRVVYRGAIVSVEVPRADPRPVRLVATLRRLALGGSLLPMTAVVGLTEADGTPLLVRVGGPDAAHVLAAGGQGTEVTGLLRAFALSLALTTPPPDLTLVLVDPLGEAWEGFAPLPHLVRPVARGEGRAAEALESLARLTGRRGPNAWPPVVAVLAYLEALGGEAEQALAHLVAEGPGAAIHVVGGVSVGEDERTGALFQMPFPVRLVGGVGNAAEARQATGWAGTAAERLESGDFVAVGGRRMIPFHAATVSVEEVRRMVTGLAPEDGAPSASYEAGDVVNGERQNSRTLKTLADGGLSAGALRLF